VTNWGSSPFPPTSPLNFHGDIINKFAPATASTARGHDPRSDNSMSTPQGNSACPITVDRPTADVWRIEAKKVLMFNHEPFEDYLDYLPCRQLALADIYRDATAVIDAVDWDPDTAKQTESVEGPDHPGPRPAVAPASLRPAGHQPRPPGRHQRRQRHQRHRHGPHPRKPPRNRSTRPRAQHLQRHHHYITTARLWRGQPRHRSANPTQSRRAGSTPARQLAASSSMSTVTSSTACSTSSIAKA